MKRRFTRLLAAVAALALSVQSTGAASLPISLMTPRAAFPPPAARFAAFPPSRPEPAAAAKAPSGASWLESARIVSDFVLQRVREELDPQPAPPAPTAEMAEAAKVVESFAPVAALPPDAAPAESSVITPLNPGVTSPSDRMMVVMEPGRSVAAVLDAREPDFSTPPSAAAGPAPVIAPFRERWLESGGLRARVTYLRSHGVIRMDPGGFTAAFADGTTRHAPSQNLPATPFREFPIYFHGEEVELEMTIQNKTGRTLNDVRLEAVQETFRPVGTEGTRLAPSAAIPVAKSLAPGKSATVRWRARLEGPAHAAVNLEQTHVRVTADGQAAPLLDAPQAGVIDPPGPGWR